MHRRGFLKASSTASLGAAASLFPVKDTEGMAFPAPPPLPFQNEKSKLKITSVRMVNPRPKRPLPQYTPAAGSWSTGGV